MLHKTTEGFRLSPQQKRLWLLQKNGFTSTSNCTVTITGKLDVEVIKTALQKVINRHEILRTNLLKTSEIKIPIQIIDASGSLSWNNFNLINLSAAEQTTKIQKIIQSAKKFNFDLEKGLLLHASLLNLSPNKHLICLSLPSLCADIWSLKNIIQEIYNLQNQQLFEEPIQYLQFSEWQNEFLNEKDETGKTYWQQQNSDKFLKLPFEGKISDNFKFVRDVYSLKTELEIVAKLEATITIYKTKNANLLFACWQILLWKLTEKSNITIRTVFTNRKFEELHPAVGLLAKWLPINCLFQDNSKFFEVLAKISETLHQHEIWQEYFIEEDNTDTTGTISFEFIEIPANYNAGEVTFAIEELDVCFEPFKVKLKCIQKEESLITEFHYNPELITKEAVECLAEQYHTLLKNAVNSPELTVSELEIISDRQLQKLLLEFNHTQINYPQDKCIHHLFETQVEKTPHKIAVVFEEQKLTYTELNTRANQLAHYLQKLRVGQEILVGIYVERSLDIIVALLGILKAGAAYLPLDAALPTEGLKFRLQDAQVSVLLTQQSLVEKLPETNIPVVCLDTDWQIIVEQNQTNPQNLVKPENLVYAIFTSGSTGQPKAVAVEHRQLLNYLYGILERLNLPADANFALVSTFAADLGNTVIFPALSTGGCLHIISPERASDAQALAKYFQQHLIDCLKIVPSHLIALLASFPPQSIFPRQCLILGGEASSWDLIEKIQAQAPQCQIFNHYGPTETTVGVLTYQVQDNKNSYHSHTIPLGKPLANTQVYVLNQQLQPVSIGVLGELYIGGTPITRGYLNRPELTAERFIQNPFLEVESKVYKTGDLVRYLPDGNLEFLGRVDNQIKIRGFRIELGEIETLVVQYPGVKQSVASIWEEELGNQRLVAYIVVDKKQPPNISDLRNFLKEKLPEYMLPSNFVILKAFPLTINGKVDRLNLPVPHQVRPELEQTFVAPSNEVEQTIATIWQEMLHVEKVGINDNFFELGGHSLLIVQVHSKLRKAFNQDVSITDLFKYPTISLLSNYLNQQQSENSSFEEVHKQVEKRLASRKKRAEFRQKI